jgi:hypothetical protein
VVVAFGETDMVPLTATLPIPWSMETEVAFSAFQESVVDWPAVMLMLLAETFSVGGGAGGGVATAVPPHPESASANAKSPATAAICALKRKRLEKMRVPE